MKTFRCIFTVMLAVAFSTTTFAQMHDHSKMVAAQTVSADSKTATFKVSGNCETCKARIEKAARVDGVSKADWNVKTKMLTLVYKPSKVQVDNIQKRIAAVGHDTPKYKASDKVYNALPGCCKYR